MKEIPDKQIIEDINTMFWAAYSAVCHCAKQTEGEIPSDCPCDPSKQEAISMLVSVRKELLKRYE